MFRNREGRSAGRVLSIYPVSRGFGYALFDAPLSPEDWGVRHVVYDETCAQIITAIKDLLFRYRPDVLVIDDIADHHVSGGARRARIYRAISRSADSIGIEVAVVSRRQIKRAFAPHGAITKQEIAELISRKLDAFSSKLPKARKIWQSEPRGMALFDAASRALTYYYCELEENM